MTQDWFLLTVAFSCSSISCHPCPCTACLLRDTGWRRKVDLQQIAGGIGKKQVDLVLVVSKRRRGVDLVLSSDRDERRMPNVAWRLFQRTFSFNYQVCPVLLTASSALDVALMEGTGQSPEGPPSFLMEPVSSLSSVSKKESETSPMWHFHPQPPADSIPQKSHDNMETFSHQLLW